MQKLRALNSRELKELYKELEERFGSKTKLDFIVLEGADNRYYLLSKGYEKLDVDRLRVNNKGVYFGTKERDGFRLSIEGAQLINAEKNIVELDYKKMTNWVRGEDVKREGGDGYVIVKYKNDVIGCGRIVKNNLRNMVPKERRLKELVPSREDIGHHSA